MQNSAGLLLFQRPRDEFGGEGEDGQCPVLYFKSRFYLRETGDLIHRDIQAYL